MKPLNCNSGGVSELAGESESAGAKRGLGEPFSCKVLFVLTASLSSKNGQSIALPMFLIQSP